jgi:hypothetical protein
MAAEYLGGGSIGSKIPIALSATAAASAAITASLGPAQARLAGAVQAAAAVTVSPPSLAAIASLAAAAAASIQAALTAPTVGVSATVAADLVIELGLIVAALEAQLDVILQLEAILGTAGVHAYLVEGETGQMGNDLQSQLAGGAPGGSGPEQLGTGVYLFANDNGAIAALRTVFGA